MAKPASNARIPPLFAKLNLRAPMHVLVLGAPATFEPVLATLKGSHVVRDVRAIDRIEFALAFAERKADLDHFAGALVPKAPGDPILWFAYPKATSKRYTCDFNRDRGWEVLERAGFAPVRQVAIDADWSALRFRRGEHIGTAGHRASP